MLRGPDNRLRPRFKSYNQSTGEYRGDITGVYR